MTPFGLIARADQGGLGAQTLEMARHTHPAKILVVDLGPDGRGHARVDRYHDLGAEVLVSNRYPKPKHLDWLLDGMHSVYTAEGTYGDLLSGMAARAGVRLVVHANPELWSERLRDATTEVVTPTSWEQHRVPDSTVMPMPVDRGRLPWRQRERARTFWHPAAPAMGDRNGTNLVLDALRYVANPIRLVVSGSGHEPGETRIGRSTIEFVAERENYWDSYADADVLVLPRRYGGLSLPVQEALSSGLPVVMLDTGPYRGLGGVLTVAVSGCSSMPMKGGLFDVYDADPALLADQITELAEAPSLAARVSEAADATAETLSWDHWTAPWTELLAG